MLTEQLLGQNPALKDLTDDQKKAIAQMSKNDEDQVIGAKIGEIHGGYDKDVLEITGVSKNDGEKSYDYVKRVMKDLKSQKGDPEMKTKLEAAQKEVETLKQQIKDGKGDEALKQQLADAKNQVEMLQKQSETEKAKYKEAEEGWKKQMVDVKIDNAFRNATAGLKLKEGIPETLRDILLKQAKDELLGLGTPEFSESGDLVIRDKDNKLLSDPSKGMAPYSLKDLLLAKTCLANSITVDPKQPGGGTGNPGGGNQGGGKISADLSGCRTQSEVMKAIDKAIMESGITYDDPKFQEMRDQMCDDYKFNEYPSGM